MQRPVTRQPPSQPPEPLAPPRRLRARARVALRQYRVPLAALALLALISISLTAYFAGSNLRVRGGAGARQSKAKVGEPIIGLTSWGLRPASWTHQALKDPPRYQSKDGKWAVPRQVQTPVLSLGKHVGKRNFGCLPVRPQNGRSRMMFPSDVSR